MGGRILLEVAVGSVDDALVAERGGADRLELNSALELGGLTPSLGCLFEVRQAVSLPIMMMIRPRAGGFVYSSRHFQVMLRDIDLALDCGADGIVFGVLNADSSVDEERCREVMRRTGDHVAVFHRAFDLVADPSDSLERLIDLGVKRVLTSGQRSTAREGAVLISELIQRSAGRIEILPAAGISPATVMEVVENTGCGQVHASLRSGIKVAGRVGPADPREEFRGFGTSTDADAVVAMRKLLG